MPYHKSLGHPDGQMLFIQFPLVAGKKWNFESSLLVKCPGENERKKKTEKEKEALKRYLLS